MNKIKDYFNKERMIYLRIGSIVIASDKNTYYWPILTDVFSTLDLALRLSFR